MDRTGAIAPMLPSVICEDSISTPLPRPLEEYGTPVVDESISSIWDVGSPSSPPADSFARHLAWGISILDRAINLTHIPPESPGDTAQLRTPKAYEQVKRALETLERDLGMHVNWTDIGLDAPSNHILVCSTPEMRLISTFSWAAPGCSSGMSTHLMRQTI